MISISESIRRNHHREPAYSRRAKREGPKVIRHSSHESLSAFHYNNISAEEEEG